MSTKPKTQILSWNVNGIRAALRNGFLEWLTAAQPDILCIQESRALPGDLKKDVLEPDGYISLWNPAKKKGYAGTAAFVKEPPLRTDVLGDPVFDDEGRVQILEYKKFTIINGYWPNSQPERRRLDFKLAYCKAVTERANELVKAGKNVILAGDMNIAHKPIDLARPDDNEDSPGFYIEEREAMTEILGQGYVDTFRHFCKEPDQYTWWSYRTRARDRNVGWRIDYHLVNKKFMRSVKRAWIASDVMGSDHCPVGIEVA